MDDPANNCTLASSGSDGEDALTCIHGPIHCAAADVPDVGEDDLQQIDVRSFIDTLAEIALAIARRQSEQQP